MKFTIWNKINIGRNYEKTIIGANLCVFKEEYDKDI